MTLNISIKKSLIFIPIVFFQSCGGKLEKKEVYYSDGSLKEVYTVKEDHLHGEYFSYFSNGIVAAEMQYENGKISGERKV